MKARGTPEPRCRAQALVLREEQHNRDYAPVDALRRQVREHSNHLSGRLISLQEDHDSYRSSHLRTIHYLPQLCAQENWVCECCGSGIAIPVGAARGCARRGRACAHADSSLKPRSFGARRLRRPAAAKPPPCQGPLTRTSGAIAMPHRLLLLIFRRRLLRHWWHPISQHLD